MRVDLSETECAFVRMVIEEHTALIQNANARKEQRLAVLLKEKGVPDGTPASINPDDKSLSYE